MKGSLAELVAVGGSRSSVAPFHPVVVAAASFDPLASDLRDREEGRAPAESISSVADRALGHSASIFAAEQMDLYGMDLAAAAQ